MKTNKILNIILTVTVLFTTVASAVQPVTASAQQQEPEIVRAFNAESGKVSMISGADNQPIEDVSAMVSALSDEERVDALAQRFAPEFGVSAADLKVEEQTNPSEGRITTRYQQTFNNLPVIGGELIINANDQGEMYSMNGETAQGLALDTKPAFNNETAIQMAKQGMVKWYGGETSDYTYTGINLAIFDEKLLQPSIRPAELVWKLEMIPADQSQPVREFVLVNAKTGNISFHFNQVDTAWSEARVENKSFPEVLASAEMIRRQDEATPTPSAPVTETPMPNLPTATPTPLPQEQPTQEPEVNAQAGNTYYVNIATGLDSNNCTSPSTPCQHIQEAINKAASNDTIKVASGTYYKSTNPNPNVLQLDNKNLTISGGWNSAFTAQDGVSIIDGSVNSVKTNNGILLVSGIVTVDHFIIQNSKSNDSGAVYIVNGNFTLQNSTLKNNQAGGNGAGIYVANGTVNVINSTISGNTAGASGGGIHVANSTVVNIQNSTIAYNTVTSGGGGGIARANGTANITNTIIAKNSASSTEKDCKGTISTANYSIIENLTGCTITSGSHNKNIDPQIDSSLSDTMQVHALLIGSPAINAGINTNCPSTDQRGITRPQGSVCDIGAFEYENPDSSMATSIRVNGSSNLAIRVSTVLGSPLGVIVKDQYDNPMQGITVTFTAPESGASGTFSGTGIVTTSTTNASGIATASTFTANATVGSYVVEATAPGIATPAQFQIENYVPTPTTISVNAGSAQSVHPNTVYPTLLKALVKDQFSSPIQGVVVTFTAPESGASGTFAGTLNNVATATTNTSGIATAPVFTANGIPGAFTVNANVAEMITPASFELVNYSGIIYVSKTGSDSSSCTTSTSPCLTINAAIGKAAANDTVYIAEGTYTAASGSEVVSITKNITLSGGWDSTFTAQDKATIIDGQNLRRGLYVMFGQTATVEHVIVQNGYGSNDGGGIYVVAYATLTLRNSTIINNNIGISSNGSLTTTNSTISFNSPGGGISSSGSGGTLNIQNSTIAYNQGLGGGISISSSAQPIQIKNSIIAHNHNSYGNEQDCNITSNPAIITSENNIIGKTEGCTILTGSGNQYNVDPKISAYPIGSLRYLALLPDSPAINGGNPATCMPTDQRGASRLADTCDIGAYEYKTPGSVSTIAISTGDQQYIRAGLPAISPLAVYAADDVGSPVGGVSVTFTAPTSGASGTFNGTNPITLNTDASGLAVVPFTATLLTGSYTVTAESPALPGTLIFNLTNGARFVSNTGVDTGDCSVSTNPCLTLNYAIGKTNNADIVMAASGTYTGSGISAVIYVAGTYKNLVILGGWNSNFTAQTGMSIIDGQSSRGGISFSSTLNSTRNLALDHFIVQNTKDSGIEVDNASLTMTNVTVRNATGSGVRMGDQGDLVIKNSTITGIAGTSYLAGIYAYCDFCSVTVINSTIVNNSRGIYADNVVNGGPDPVTKIFNSIIANNRATNGNAADCNNVNLSINNIIGNTTGCTILSNINSQLNVSPQITRYPVGVQAYYALLAGSPAINAGDPATCAISDARGMARPQGSACDIGAYEYTAPGGASLLGISVGEYQRVTTFSTLPSPMAAYVVDSNGSPVSGVDVTFTAPASGASGTFKDNGTNSVTLTTDQDGIADLPALDVNTMPGAFNITAFAAGINTANFSILSVGWYASDASGNDTNTCSTPFTPCKTITAAISKAVEGDTVYVTSETYTSTATEVVRITKNMKLSGGWNADFTLRTGFTTLDGQNARRGMSNEGHYFTVSVEKFIVENGFSQYEGGGIYHYGPLELRNSIIRNNSAQKVGTNGYGGGGIYSDGGGLTLIDSRVENNSSTGKGGGIYAMQLDMFSSVVKGNAAEDGGGIYAEGNSTITNSIILQNTASQDGGGVNFYINSVAYKGFINNSNILNNTAGHQGGGVYKVAEGLVDYAINLRNSIFLNNTAPEGNECYGKYAVSSNLLMTDPGGCWGARPTSTDNPQLNPYFFDLFGYMPLVPGSPAIGAGDPATCALTDQRGAARLQDGKCDIGAYEYMPSGPIETALILGYLPGSAPGYPLVEPLTVLAMDGIGSPATSKSIIFTAPASGPGGTFLDTGTNTSTKVVDIYGIVRVSDFIPNNQFGAYTIIAGGIPNPLSFFITNQAFYVSPTGSDEGGNTCMDSSQPCRAVNTAISKILPGNGVFLAAGTYAESINITQSAAIAGGWNSTFTSRSGKTFIDGQSIRQNILVDKDMFAQIVDLNITNGYASQGAGIYNEGNLRLRNVSIYNNVTYNDGAGIYQKSGSLDLVNVTVSNNTGNSSGGGIYVYDGVVDINNSTITQNVAVDPSYPAIGGGLSNYFNKPVTIKNTIIAANVSDSDPDCRGQITSGGHNLIGYMDNCILSAASANQIGISPLNPNLGNLLDNGGGTLTHALLIGSPAIDAGDPLSCAVVDQRGIERPQGAACDIGAFEGGEVQTVLPTVRTYSAINTNAMPGILRCSQYQANCTGGADPHADKAQQFALGTYQLYLDKHERNSIDNNNMPILSTVHYQPDPASLYANAFWSGSLMIYGNADQLPYADDVAAHELTHGVTQYESNLLYFYQSGAINESLSDLWGEYYDQTNGVGTDTVAVKWLIGEDIKAGGTGAFRSMSNPPAFGDPDKTTSSLYNNKSLFDSGFDNGGVHTNSGVNNKAVYLMVDGGTFNGKAVTSIGWDKTAAIYYEAQTNLLYSGSNYSDLYYAVQQACTILSITNYKNITLSDCIQVKNALDAVQMNLSTSFNATAELCPAGSSTGPNTTIFTEDFENGINHQNMSYYWKLTDYAPSSLHAVWGDDAPTSTYSGMSINVNLPAGTSYLYFRHAFGFEYYGNEYYDGGLLRYSVDSGESKDISSLFSAGKNYNGTILNYPGTTNFYAGYQAFVGDSHGYTATRYNLTPLAGKYVHIIWSMATDQTYNYLGWFIDDIRVYTCSGLPAIPTLTTPMDATIAQTRTPTLDWSDITTDLHHYQVQVATDSTFRSIVHDKNNITTSQYTLPVNLNMNTTYYWRVRSFNVADGTNGWSTTWSFTTGGVPAAFGKTNPVNKSINQPSLLTLKWMPSNGVSPATSYEYCYDKTNDNQCSTWTKVGDVTSVELSNLSPRTTYYWQVRAVNGFGTTISNSNVWHSFTTGAVRSITFTSAPAYDGWLLESRQNSGAASMMSPSGNLRVGDDAQNRQYRSVLSFDTSKLPDNAVVTKVTVKVKKAGITGRDPFISHGDLLAEMKKGFFGLLRLELTDFLTPGDSFTPVGKFTALSTPTGWYQMNLSPVNFKLVNPTGTTQFRLKFFKANDADRVADILQLFGGEDWLNKPQIVIEYMVP